MDSGVYHAQDRLPSPSSTPAARSPQIACNHEFTLSHKVDAKGPNLRRTRFEIAEDKILQDRIDNLTRLIAAPETSPESREKFHRQLSATRARQTRRKTERLRKRELRKRELAEQQREKLADAPAPQPSP